MSSPKNKKKKKCQDDDDLMAFSKTLEGFGYEFKDGKQLTHKITGEKFVFDLYENHSDNQRRYEALGEVITEYVYTLLESEDVGLKKLEIPLNANSKQAKGFIFVSEGYEEAEKLLVLVHGSGVVRAGQWARRLIINDCLDHGTQIPYIKKGCEEHYGIVVLNTNQNEIFVEGKGMKDIEESETPERHSSYVWKHIIEKANAEKIFVVAHSYGGFLVVDHMMYNRKTVEKIVAVAFTDSVHSLNYQTDGFIKEWFEKNSVNWVTSTKDLGTPMFYGQPPEHITRISAGTTKHEETSWKAMDSIFLYFKNKERDFKAGDKRKEEEKNDSRSTSSTSNPATRQSKPKQNKRLDKKTGQNEPPRLLLDLSDEHRATGQGGTNPVGTDRPFDTNNDYRGVVAGNAHGIGGDKTDEKKSMQSGTNTGTDDGRAWKSGGGNVDNISSDGAQGGTYNGGGANAGSASGTGGDDAGENESSGTNDGRGTNTGNTYGSTCSENVDSISARGNMGGGGGANADSASGNGDDDTGDNMSNGASDGMDDRGDANTGFETVVEIIGDGHEGGTNDGGANTGSPAGDDTGENESCNSINDRMDDAGDANTVSTCGMGGENDVSIGDQGSTNIGSGANVDTVPRTSGDDAGENESSGTMGNIDSACKVEGENIDDNNSSNDGRDDGDGGKNSDNILNESVANAEVVERSQATAVDKNTGDAVEGENVDDNNSSNDDGRGDGGKNSDNSLNESVANAEVVERSQATADDKNTGDGDLGRNEENDGKIN